MGVFPFWGCVLAVELAAAYLPLIPTMRGAKRQIQSELGREAVPAAAVVGKEAGRKMGVSLTGGVAQSTKATGGLFRDLGRTASASLEPVAGRVGDRFRQGFRTVSGGAREAEGAIGRVGAATAKLTKPVWSLSNGFKAGFSDSARFVGNFEGKLGSVGTRIGDLTRRSVGIGQNFVSGFRSSEAAASSFTGRVGTLGGKVGDLARRAASPGREFVIGFKKAGDESASFQGKFQKLGGSVGTFTRGATSAFSTFGSSISGAFSGVGSSVSSAFSGISQRISAVSTSLVRLGSTAITVGTGIAAVVGGIALKGGIKRALDIEDAQAKLRGLGHDTETVDGIMKNALASVKGTAFGLGEAATTAAQAVASGIEPGDKLEQVLKTVANSAAAAGVGMDEMGAVFGKAMAAGKAQNDVLYQLSDKGIPIYQALAKQLNVTSDEVFKMASKGKIDFETFEKAAREAVGTVADEMGKTTRGQIKNFFAALSRLGEAVVKPLLAPFQALVQGGTALADALTDKVKPAMAGAASVVGAFVASFSGLKGRRALVEELADNGITAVRGFGKWLVIARDCMVGFTKALKHGDDAVVSTEIFGVFERLGASVHKVVSWFKGFAASVPTPVIVGLSSAAGLLGLKLGTAAAAATPMGKIIGKIGSVIAPLIPGVGLLGRAFTLLTGPFGMIASLVISAITSSQELRDKIMGLGRQVLDLASGAGGKLAPVFGNLSTSLLPALRDIFSGLIDVVAQVLIVVVDLASTLISVLVPVIASIARVVLPVLGVALKFIGWVIATVLFPVIKVLAVILGTVLAAAVQVAGAVIKGVFDGIAAAARGVVAFWQNTLVPGTQAAFQAVGNAAVWLYQNAILPVWNGIKAAINAVGAWIVTTLVPMIQTALQAIGAAMNWLYQNIVKPLWNGILVTITVIAAVLLTIFQGIAWAVDNTIGRSFRYLRDNVVIPVWNGIKAAITMVWVGIRDGVFIPLMNFVRGPLTSAWNWLKNLVSQVWTAIRSTISFSWNWVRDVVLVPLINFVRGALTSAWTWLRNLVSQVWTAIRVTVSTGWNWIRDRVLNPLIGFIRGTLAAAWNFLRDKISQVWNVIRGASIAAWNFLRGRVFDPIKGGLDNLKQAFHNTQDGIAKAWDKLREAVKKPVGFVVNHVINPFIDNYNKINDFWKGDDIGKITGFARGGVLPGYQRAKKDDVLTPMRSGEGVLVPEVVRGIGGADTINTLNAAGNAGGVGAVQKLWKSGNLHRPVSSENEQGMYAAGPRQAGPGTYLWGAIQTQMNRTGRLYVPHTRVLGADIAEAAKAWMGQSALDIIAGNGGPSVSAGVGHRGAWGFADTSGRLEISTTTPANRRMGVAIHELGHILSLDHSGDGSYGDTSSVMSAGMSGGDWPHPIDYAVLRRVWGQPGEGVTRYSASDVDGVTANSIDPVAWIADKLDKWITGPIKRAKEKFAGNKFSQMPLGIASSLFDGIKKKAAELAAPFLGVVDAGKKVVSGAVSQVKVRTWMNKALGMKGILNPGNMASGVARAMKESGGDPNIIQQIIDQNSGGNEARGLMQVTPTTFRENMEPGHGNIFDPIDNILASINYTIRRYGSVRSGWDLPGGYALGGVVDGVWDNPVGSVQALRPGVNTIYNGTGTAEYFQRISKDSDSSGRPPIHVETIQALDVDEAMRKLRREIAWEEALYS